MSLLYRLTQSVKQIFPRGSIGWKILRTPVALYFWIKSKWRRMTKNSIFVDEFEIVSCSLEPTRTLDLVMQLYKPKSVLDLGCGTGKALDYFINHGVDCIGIEGSALAIRKANNPQRIRQFNLNRPLKLDRTFDLVWSYEVLEHIHPDYLENLMNIFVAAGPRVVLSAAPPGQGGEGHFNEQRPEYWIQQFKKHGFELDEAATRQFHTLNEAFSGNMLAFYRPGAAQPISQPTTVATTN
jgi:SAM-dependent methyltransferase